MYICISTLKKVRPNEILFLEKELDFGEIAAKEIGGRIIGFVMHDQPAGCVGIASAVKNIGGKRIMAQVALVAGDVAVLHSESTALMPAAAKDGRLQAVIA